MRAVLLVIALIALPAGPALGDDAVTVLQETRTRQPGKRQQAVAHVALLKNTSIHSIRGLRVTVELYDAFGKLLWTKTVTAGPSALRPGETASLSVSTPHIEAYKRTVYRFAYRFDPKSR